MNILNELVELANKANVAGQGTPEMVEFRVVANPDNILAIAEAFRALEQRAEAVEAKLVPDGWQLVPVEPTEEMINAGDQFMDGLSRLGDAYDAMVAAAPNPSK
ncbi:hypothetical protein [Pantoea vagans]|uniref:hypothetical protein n=1 Tax=Pantoea vagans TaxID=470934 RepID=UPI00076B0BFA|nr:hypothetical protein [Pantoea vagans]AMG57711.1 hypothetical protein AL522_08725 [Pantoea vagans]